MNRLLLVALTLTLWASPGAARPSVGALVRAAHEAYDRKDFGRALELYESAIRAGAKLPTTFYNAACSAALAGRTDDAFIHLEKALDAGYVKGEHLEADDDFVNLHADPRWRILVARAHVAAASFTTSIAEPALRDELVAMRRADLAMRLERRREPDRKPRLAALHEADAKRTARLREIVKQYGWPGRAQVGADGAHAAWLIARHAEDLGFQRRCLQLLEAAAPDEVDPRDLAALTDVVLFDEGKKQKYGTLFQKVKGVLVPRPIEDPAHVDERRKALGLPTLAEYQKHLVEHAAAPEDSTGS